MDRQQIRTKLTEKVGELKRGRGDGHEIARLVEVLDRIEKGQYELCAECGEAIGEERLLEAPTVTLCVSCESADSWRPGSKS